MTMASAPPALRVHNLRKTYKDVVAVDGLSLDVGRGECFGLLGPNGAGKTTTIEICEGLTEPDTGDIEVLGMRWTTDAAELRQQLGIQLQDTQLSDKLTVAETLRLFRSFYHQGPSATEAIALVQLQEERSARVGALSGGQKQRLALACALVGDRQLLFLDEPTTGLDPQARRQLWDLITEFKRAGFSAIGMLVGSRAKTIEAISGIINIVIMPMWLVSGVFFSAQRFPDVAQPIIRVLPLTLLLDALRAVQLQGATLWDVRFELTLIATWLVVCFVAALKLFRWR